MRVKSLNRDNGESGRVEHSAGSASGHVGSASHTTSSFKRGDVQSTRRSLLAKDSDVSLLSPGGAPGVANKPVVLTGGAVGSVAFENNGVVDIRVNLVAAVEDTTLVRVPSRSINTNAQRTVLNGVEDGSVLVGRELLEAFEVGDRAGGSIVEHASVVVTLV